MQNVFRELTQSYAVFKSRLFLIALFGLGGFVAPVFSATPANTLIENFATVDYVVDAAPFSTVSNTVSFRVDELISFTLLSNDPSGVAVQSPQTSAVLSYSITNQGNASEAFSLSLTQSVSDNFDPATSLIYLDSNDNDSYDDGVDTLYTPTVNDPSLSADSDLTIFVVSSIQASLPGSSSAEITLNVSSKTGSGPAGTSYDGLGEGGVDALIGLQGGALSQSAQFNVGAATLTKSVTVLAPDGGSAPVQNAIMTYTLTLNVAGSGSITSVSLGDVIPAGTAYVASSMRLNTLPLTDAADADAGVFNGTAVQVLLGTVVAPTTNTVTFQVRIQ